MIILAILIPPLAVLLCGKPFQALFNLILMVTLFGWPLAALHAIIVTNARNADKRTQRMIDATKAAAAANIAASAEARASQPEAVQWVQQPTAPDTTITRYHFPVEEKPAA